MPEPIQSVANLNRNSRGIGIIVRVVYKSDLIACANGIKFLKLHLMDASGMISAFAFDYMAKVLANSIEIEKIYSLSNFHIDWAYSHNTHLQHNYLIKIHDYTKIELNRNHLMAHNLSYNFLTIDEITQMDEGTTVDCIAVCRDSKLTKGRTVDNREYHKRVLKLFDSSKSSIELTLWNDVARDLNNHPPFIIALKRAIIKVYQRKNTLNLPRGSDYKINPILPESYCLKKR